MDDRISALLDHNQVLDMTTTGCRTGQPRRIEIYLHSFDGRLVISGMPNPSRTRAWIHNLEADPALTLHLRDTGSTYVEGTARIVTDPAERRALLERVARNWGRTDLDAMVAYSPLIEITVPGYPGRQASSAA